MVKPKSKSKSNRIEAKYVEEYIAIASILMHTLVLPCLCQAKSSKTSTNWASYYKSYDQVSNSFTWLLQSIAEHEFID